MELCEAYNAIDEERARKERLITLEAKYKDMIDAELYYARRKFSDFHSAHEGFAVIAEEMAELWEAVRLKQSTPDRTRKMRVEAIQVAAMALRFLTDCCENTEEIASSAIPDTCYEVDNRG